MGSAVNVQAKRLQRKADRQPRNRRHSPPPAAPVEVLDLSLTTAIDPCTVMLARRLFTIAFVRFKRIPERRVGSVLGRLRRTD
jgi:hypothetical protein